MQTATRRTITEARTIQDFSQDFPARFWSNVNKDGSIPQHMQHLGKCWEWTAYQHPSGYCLVRTGNKAAKKEYCHRVSWLLSFGALPDGVFVLHKCDNRKCVNPSHLFLGNHLDNARDKYAKQRNNNPRGEQHGRSKLTRAIADQIFALRNLHGVGLRQIAERYGIDKSHVCAIASGKIWKR